MKSIGKIILSITIVVIIAGGAYFLFHEKPEHVAEHNDTYYCPMHPSYTSPKPGVCPICHMNLVKKEQPQLHEETVSGYTKVSLNSEKQQLIGIKTTAVVRKPVTKTIHAFGYVAHDLELYEAQLDYIFAWHDYYPYISRRPVKGEFRQDWRQYYKDGPAGNRWRSDEKLKAQQQLIKAEYELIHLGLTEQQLEQLREVKYGQPWVQPDLLFMEEGQPRWVYAQIFESDLGFIDVGQKVTITIPAYNETTEGIVRSVAPIVDQESRTVRVRIELPDYKGDLHINMFVNAEMKVELNSYLLVPREAVMDTGLRKIVFVESQHGVFDPREIQIGFEGDGMVAVKSGLKEGETIVSSGNFLLDSESRLQSSIDQGGHSHD